MYLVQRVLLKARWGTIGGVSACRNKSNTKLTSREIEKDRWLRWDDDVTSQEFEFPPPT
jgi:hypothetical protein